MINETTGEGMKSVPPDVEEGLAVCLAKLFLVFGGVVPYIPQYIHIMRTKDCSGFSTKVCMVVIVSSVLRISYWFGHWFDIALLWQSFIMTGVMLALLELCLRTHREHAAESDVRYLQYHFMDFRPNHFWRWTDLQSYIEATFALLVFSSVYTMAFAGHDFLVEPVGFAALLIESTLAMPQFMKNYKKRSTNGMNIYMPIFWTVGDLVKAFFFFYTSQPIPFRMCVTIQLIVDAALFYQVKTYE